MSNYIVVNGIRIASDFEPETFGRLTTIGPRFTVSNTDGRRHVYQVCECTCGTVGVFNRNGLVTGNSGSCGCYTLDKCIESLTKHGDCYSSEYKIWIGAKDRCYNTSNPGYRIYGGRGIKVCDRWLEPDGRGYMNFLEDMGRRPSTKHSIDRIDVNGHYEPKNCRWATRTEQARNKRNSRFITALSKTQTLAAWAEEYNIHPATLKDRLNSGMSLEEAIAHPKGASYTKGTRQNDIQKSPKQ